MRYPYIIVDNNHNIDEALHQLKRFNDFSFAGAASSNEDAVDLILEQKPAIVFLCLHPSNAENNISLYLTVLLLQFLMELPYFVIISPDTAHAYDALKAGARDYLLLPLRDTEVTRCIYRLRKALPLTTNPASDWRVMPSVLPTLPPEIEEKKISQICIKSYGDYQFIALDDVLYLKADNNTTDFHLQTGRKLTAYKTLKFFENSLPANFVRIHNSYIVNSHYVTRISAGKSLCYLNGNDVSVSFSKTYKENIDSIIKAISDEYL